MRAFLERTRELFVRISFLILFLLPHGAETASAQAFLANYCTPNGRDLYFIIDVTTAFSQNDKERIQQAYTDFIRQVRGGDRIIIKTIGEHVTTFREVARECWPGCPPGGVLGRLSCSEGRVRTDEVRARNYLKTTLRRLIEQAEERRSSAIAYSLQALFHALNPQRHALIYIYSDMIENSREIPLRRFLSTRNAQNVFRDVQFRPMQWRDIRVRIYGVGRSADASRAPLTMHQINDIRRKWNYFFQRWGINQDQVDWNGL